MCFVRAVLKRMWPVFKPLEKRLLSELAAHLEAPARNLLERQLELVNRVYRRANYQEVSCYCLKRGMPYREASLQFPAKDADLKFATIRFSAASSSEAWTASFHMVDGYFFSIIITPSPSAILGMVQKLAREGDT